MCLYTSSAANKLSSMNRFLNWLFHNDEMFMLIAPLCFFSLREIKIEQIWCRFVDKVVIFWSEKYIRHV